MIVVYCPFYTDQDQSRNQELRHCITSNLSNPEVDRVVGLCDDHTAAIPDSKFTHIPIGRRPTYNDFFEIASIINPYGINILVNTDIEITPSATALIEESLQGTGTVLALSRWDAGTEPTPYAKRDSQDCWAWRGVMKADGPYMLGKPGCDNKIALEFAKRYNVVNPCLDIKVIHHHATSKRNYTSQDRYEPPYHFVPPVKLLKNLRFQKVMHIGINIENQKSLCRALSTGVSYLAYDWRKRLQEVGGEAMRQELIEKAQEFNPDLSFFQIQNADAFDQHTISKIPGYRINFTGDVRDPLPSWFVNLAPFMDMTVFSNRTDTEKMAKKGWYATQMQMGFEKALHRPGAGSWELPPIVFLANHYQDRFPQSQQRYEMAHALKKEFGDDFMLCGQGWDMEAVNLNGKPEMEATAYRSCKIAISASQFPYYRYTSARLFRAMASGAFVLAQWYPGIEEDFVDGQHLRVFHNTEEMVGLCRMYLSSNTERQRIAQAGCDHVRKNFNWHRRISELVSMTGFSSRRTDVIAEKRPYKSSAPAINYQSRQYNAQFNRGSKMLSIQIPTIESRQFQFKNLLASLIRQINALGAGTQVEVLHIPDKGKKEEDYYSIGKKRNDLLAQAVGRYVVSIDDDDEISEDYVKLILEQAEKNPDCITFNGRISINGTPSGFYNFGIEHTQYIQIEGGYLRPPGHLTPIKWEIASQFKFHEYEREKDKGSDVHWSLDIARSGLLKSCIHIDKEMYHYRLNTSKNE